MQKVIYLLWRDNRSSAEDFFHRLRTELAAQLNPLGAQQLQLNLADADVAPAARQIGRAHV